MGVLWITPMPCSRRNEDENWTAQHHPFTRPTDDSLLLEDDPGAASAVAYDLVGNGIELAGGSIRIHEPELQAHVRLPGDLRRRAAREVRLSARRAGDGRPASRRIASGSTA